MAWTAGVAVRHADWRGTGPASAPSFLKVAKERAHPAVQGVVRVILLLFVPVNVAVDLSYAWPGGGVDT